MLKKYRDWIVGAFSVLFAIVLYLASMNIKQFQSSDVGAGFMPKLAAVLLFCMGLALLIQESKIHMEKTSATAKEEEPCCYKAVLATFGLILAYAALVGSVGFLLTSAVYLFLQMLVLTKKENVHYFKFVLIAAIVPGPIYFLFKSVFQIMLPAGILG